MITLSLLNERSHKGHWPLFQTRMSQEELLSPTGDCYTAKLGDQSPEAVCLVTLLLDIIAI